MKSVNEFCNARFIVISVLIILGTQFKCIAQEETKTIVDRDSLLSIARDYIGSERYCTLTTIGSTGYPHTRVMDPFKPDDNMVIWLGTNRYSRKVREIRDNPKVDLFYYDNQGTGYVSITGTAYVIDDSLKKAEYWKPEWERFYKDKKDYILIRVVPENLEVLNYKHGIFGDPKSWKVPSVNLVK